MGVGRVRTRRGAALALGCWVALLPAAVLCSSVAVQDAVETWSSWCRYGLARCDTPTSLGPFFDDMAARLGGESRRALAEAAGRLLMNGGGGHSSVGIDAELDGIGGAGGLRRELAVASDAWEAAGEWGAAWGDKRRDTISVRSRALQTALDVLVASAGLSRGLRGLGGEGVGGSGVGGGGRGRAPLALEANASSADALHASSARMARALEGEPEPLGATSVGTARASPAAFGDGDEARADSAPLSPVNSPNAAKNSFSAPLSDAPLPPRARPYSRASLPPWLWLVFALCGSLVLIGIAVGAFFAFRRREKRRAVGSGRSSGPGRRRESGGERRAGEGGVDGDWALGTAPQASPLPVVLPHPKMPSVSSVRSSSTFASSLAKPSPDSTEDADEAFDLRREDEAETPGLRPGAGEAPSSARTSPVEAFSGYAPSFAGGVPAHPSSSIATVPAHSSPGLSPLRIQRSAGEPAEESVFHAGRGESARVVIVDVQTPPSAKKRKEEAERKRVEGELVARELGEEVGGRGDAAWGPTAKGRGRAGDGATLAAPASSPPGTAFLLAAPTSPRLSMRFPTVLAATVSPRPLAGEAARLALADALQSKATGRAEGSMADHQVRKSAEALTPPFVRSESSLLRAGTFSSPTCRPSSVDPFRRPSEEVSHGAMSAKPVLSEGSWSIGEDDVVEQASGGAGREGAPVRIASALLRGASDADVVVSGIHRGPGSEQREELVRREEIEALASPAVAGRSALGAIEEGPPPEGDGLSLRIAKEGLPLANGDLVPRVVEEILPPVESGLALRAGPIPPPFAHPFALPRSATSSPRSRRSPFSRSPASSPRARPSVPPGPLSPELDPIEVLASVRRRDPRVEGWAVTGPGGMRGSQGPSASRCNPLFSEEGEERGSGTWHGNTGRVSRSDGKPGKRGREAGGGDDGNALATHPAIDRGITKSPLSREGGLPPANEGWRSGPDTQTGVVLRCQSSACPDPAATSCPAPGPESSPKRVRTDRGLDAVHVRVAVRCDGVGRSVVRSADGPIECSETETSRDARGEDSGQTCIGEAPPAGGSRPPDGTAATSLRSSCPRSPQPRRHALFQATASSHAPRFLTLPPDSDVRILDAVTFSREVSLGRLLGVGGNGCVLEGRWNGRLVAVKVLHESSQRSEQGLRDVAREIETLAAVGGHPRVVTLLGACLEPPRVCLIQALAPGGSLAAAIHDREWVGRDLQEGWGAEAGRAAREEARGDGEGVEGRGRNPRLLRVRRVAEASRADEDRGVLSVSRRTDGRREACSRAAAGVASAALAPPASAPSLAAAATLAAAGAALAAMEPSLAPLTVISPPALPAISTRGGPGGMASTIASAPSPTASASAPSSPSTPGTPLNSRWCRRPEYGTLLQILRDVAEAMAHCHGLRPPVVHRDLKPPNVLLDASGRRASVADFGLAKQRGKRRGRGGAAGAPAPRPETRLDAGEAGEGYDSSSSSSSSSSTSSTALSILTSTTVSDAAARGTAAYMPPEAFSGASVDERGDVWAWASLAHECLSGREPWAECKHVLQIVMAVGVERRCPQVPLGTPPRLAALLRACWRGEPELRPTFAEVVATLDDIRAEDLDRISRGIGAEKDDRGR